ncbi:MAG: branched-chain amino acid ABC transporter substrate-binding protein [Candidatus Rokubacteria bacterium 13_1_40CM_2_68_8]|nr:MAG: branched-chain amino acid ABC transporter substrate-binding protein [Actinobacteria bacterium 13_1_40CM_4_65_12]OLD39669.1 MAG: branched-chain amino acid ABC transporter substrate-binding protein [Candidatus Rokubacteria bacterium 13_1_40CM_2_68_8]
MTVHSGERKRGRISIGTNRRAFLKSAGVVGVAAASSFGMASLTRAESRTIKIGYIGAQSGVGANFGEATPWTVERIRAAVKDGVKIGGKSYAVELVIKDNQSDPNRSTVVSSELILRDKCDLVLCFGGDPAAAMGELADTRGVPTISTMVPWTGWKFSRGATPEDLTEKSFPYTFHFFWGAAEVVKNFLAMWNSVRTNKIVGTFYVDNPTGKAFANPRTGLPGGMAQYGYREVPAGFFKMATDEFTNQVSAFKNAGAEIVSGLVLPSHWATFWNQAAQAAYRPQVCTMAAAFLFASAITSLGPRGDGMSTEVWWTPKFPYKSSITGQTCRELANEWENATGKQWTQPIGYAHAIWEVGLAALASSGDPKNKEAVRTAIANLSVDTIVGPVRFKDSPVKNVSITSMAGGQWRKTKGGRFPFELLIVYNATAPQIPIEAELKLLSQLG